MKNVISGMVLLSLVWAGWAEPTPAPVSTAVPAPVSVPTSAPAPNQPEVKHAVTQEAPPIASAKSEKEKPARKKEPLVVKFRDF